MSDMFISLFGSPKVYIDDIEVKFQRRKTMALLAYLAVTNCTHSRDELTEIFYPDLERNKAKADFRQLLYRLKKNLGEGRVKADRFSVALNLIDNVSFDVFEFKRLIKLGKDNHDDFNSFIKAIDLYKSEFLTGFYLDKNYSFEEWQLSIQEQFHKQYISILKKVIKHLCEDKNYEEAIRLCKNWNILKPLDEQSHRFLMTLYCNSSQPSKMIEQFNRCKKLVKSELGSEPEDSTYQLYSELLDKQNQEHSVGYLPDNTIELIGRKKELTNLTQILMKGKSPLISLVGTGGVGKTVLSINLAKNVIEDYEHEIYFIDLSRITSVEEIISNISRKLDILDDQTIAESPLSKLKRFLNNNKILLILDNFEQVVDGSKFIKDLISSSKTFHILITSRIALGIKEELVFPVPPLSFPSGNLDQHKVGNIQKYDSVALFIARAEKFIPGFVAGNENLAIICNICKNLEGIPLAIELAASRLNLLTCKEIKSHLSEKLKLLVDDSPDLPDRQRTMKKTIEWSYNLLNDNEKELINIFSVFEGGATLDAIEYVFEKNALDPVSSLINKNMLIRKEYQGKSRYHMLETIREYGFLKLKQNVGLDKIRNRHAYYYLSLAKKAERYLRGPNQFNWKEQLIEDEKNILSSIQLFGANERYEEAIKMIVFLFRYWYFINRYSKMKDILKKYLIAIDSSISPNLQARGYNTLGWMTYISRDWKHACDYYYIALKINEGTDNKKERCSILYRLGFVEKSMGQIELSRKHAKQSIALARETNDPFYIMKAMQFMYSSRGLIREEDPLKIPTEDLEKRAYENLQNNLEEILNLAKGLGDLLNIGWSLTGMADHFKKIGKFKLSQKYYENALDIFIKMKDKWNIAWYRGELGWLLFLKGDIDKGLEYLKQSILLLLRMDDNYNGIIMIGRLSRLLWVSGKDHESIRFLGAYRTIFLSLTGSDSIKFNYYVDPVIEDLISKYSSQYSEEWAEGQLWEYKDLMRELKSTETII